MPGRKDSLAKDKVSAISEEYRSLSKRARKQSIIFFSLANALIIISLFGIIFIPFLFVQDETRRAILESQITVVDSQIKSYEQAKESSLNKIKSGLSEAWHPAETNTLMNIYYADFFKSGNGNALAVGEKGFMAVSEDCGETWMQLDIEIDENLLDIEFFSSGVHGSAIVVGRSGSMIRIDDISYDFEYIDLLEDRDIRDIERFGRRLFISGSSGLIKWSEDLGSNWNDVSIDTDKTIYDLRINDIGNGFLVGEKGLMAVSHNFGEDWRVIRSIISTDLNDVEFIDNDRLIVSGRSGIIFNINLKNEEIRRLNLAKERIIDIFVKDDFIALSGDGGRLIVSKDGGNEFQKRELGRINLRQINILDDFLLIPTNFGDIAFIDTKTLDHSIKSTPVRSNLSRLVHRSGLDCSFSYGFDGAVVYPSRYYLDQINRLNDTADIISFLASRLPQKLLDITNYVALSGAADSVKRLQTQKISIEQSLDDLAHRGEIELPLFGIGLSMSAITNFPLFFLILVLFVFCLRRYREYEAREDDFRARAQSIEIIALAGKKDMMEQVNATLNEYQKRDSTPIPNEGGISDILKHFRQS